MTRHAKTWRVLIQTRNSDQWTQTAPKFSSWREGRQFLEEALTTPCGDLQGLPGEHRALEALKKVKTERFPDRTLRYLVNGATYRLTHM